MQAAVETCVDAYNFSDMQTLDYKGIAKCAAPSLAPWEQKHPWLQQIPMQGFAAWNTCHQALDDSDQARPSSTALFRVAFWQSYPEHKGVRLRCAKLFFALVRNNSGTINVGGLLLVVVWRSAQCRAVLHWFELLASRPIETQH